MAAKRQLRSTITLPDSVLKEEPVIKKQRTSRAVLYLCIVCDKSRSSGAFAAWTPSDDCEHLINTCKDCLKGWVNAQIESNLTTATGEEGKELGVKCPECPALMKRKDIAVATNKTMFSKFVDLERRHVANVTPGWRWCLALGCDAGQVHEPKKIVSSRQEDKENTAEDLTKLEWDKVAAGPTEMSITKKALAFFSPLKRKVAKTVQAEEADICVCKKCGAQACVACDRPWHKGEDCATYQRRTKDRLVEEDKSLAAIAKVSRKCPSCSKNIQKNGGCPSMYCSQCNAHFCWTCMQAFTEFNRGCGCARR